MIIEQTCQNRNFKKLFDAGKPEDNSCQSLLRQLETSGIISGSVIAPFLTGRRDKHGGGWRARELFHLTLLEERQQISASCNTSYSTNTLFFHEIICFQRSNLKNTEGKMLKKHQLGWKSLWFLRHIKNMVCINLKDILFAHECRYETKKLSHWSTPVWIWAMSRWSSWL